MNRDVTGAHGQFVTTWGSEVEEGVVKPGTERPVTTTLTCRCGKTTEYRGFPTDALNHKAGFVAPLPKVKDKPEEWFCSISCATNLELRAIIARLKEIRGEIRTSQALEAKLAEEIFGK